MVSVKQLIGRYRFKKRFEIINYLIRTRGFRRYLEVGVGRGTCIEQVRCAAKTGVDPEPRVEPAGWTLHRQTSDEFFSTNRERFDLVFVDGLHLAEQVLADVLNGLAALRENGVVLVHDCNPLTEIAQRRDPKLAELGGWNGDGWKALAYLGRFPAELFRGVLEHDHGIGVVAPREPDRIPRLDAAARSAAEGWLGELSWADLEADRAGLLGLMRGRLELERRLAEAGVCRPV